MIKDFNDFSNYRNSLLTVNYKKNNIKIMKSFKRLKMNIQEGLNKRIRNWFDKLPENEKQQAREFAKKFQEIPEDVKRGIYETYKSGDYIEVAKSFDEDEKNKKLTTDEHG
jgi:HSP90 family molecular chaperone